MTLNNRERFIFHICSALMLSLKSDKRLDMQYLEQLIVKNRARKQTEDEIVTLRDEIQEEVLLSSYVYEEIIRHIGEGVSRNEWR